MNTAEGRVDGPSAVPPGGGEDATAIPGYVASRGTSTSRAASRQPTGTECRWCAPQQVTTDAAHTACREAERSMAADLAAQRRDDGGIRRTQDLLTTPW